MRDSNDSAVRPNVDEMVLPVERDGATRRTFLKLAGFGVASAALAGCSRGPVSFVVPRLDADEEGTTPGRPFQIATTCGGCEARCGVVARCRDGRPVKLEGNPDHAVSRGGLCATGQASILDLYDGRRFDGARLNGEAAAWDQVDEAVAGALAGAAGGVRVLTRTITSPSTRSWIERLVAQHGGKHVEWDPRSASALLDAHAAAFGVRALPRMHFDRAEVVVAFDADFLGTWIAPVEFAKAYAERRNPGAAEPQMSRHVQVESVLSITGCTADARIVVAPHEQRAALAALCSALAGHAGSGALPAARGESPYKDAMDGLAEQLWAARGKALVVCGSDDPGAQALSVHANRLLGSYGKTLDLELPSLARRGDDRALQQLIADMHSGAVSVLIIDGLDPVYEVPDSAAIREALAKVATIVTTSPIGDATSPLAHAIAPAPHELESWNDAEATAGHLSISQPTVPALRAARTLRASIASWLGQAGDDARLVKEHWRNALAARAGATGSFDEFFDDALRRGYVHARPKPGPSPRWNDAGWRELLAASAAPDAPAADAFTLVAYSRVGLTEARHAHNAWLHEMPDPLTTVVWDNYACINPAAAERLGLADGDVVRVATPDGATIELPARIMPGQHEGVVAIATGYGVSGTDRFSKIGPGWIEGRVTVREGDTVGRRVAALQAIDEHGVRSAGPPVSVSATGAHVDLASTQDHHRLEVPKHLATKRGAVRGAVLSTTLAQLRDDPAHAIHTHELPEASLWPPDHESDGPKWGMVIDLAACNGCSGCVVACQAENNVPCVGKDEVLRHREMTWLRIDRYFTGEGDGVQAVHQPMMCQHCANAPCETVCPVLATVHSEDGLNQQVYNRCVGTRYCANNCPYKTRRFNWFDYPRADEMQNLVLNPDVTVRSRGVMEKCSMCIQRIQEAKAESARTGMPLADGDIQTACQQSCPMDAISFGDLNDPESQISQRTHEPRAYAVLAELNVKPGVTYLANVRNRPEGSPGERHG